MDELLVKYLLDEVSDAERENRSPMAAGQRSKSQTILAF
jgi:hypothetical protein